MTDWKIERSNGCCFGQQQLVANSIKKIILHENDPLAGVFAAQKLKIIKTLLTLELSQYGSTFSSSRVKRACCCQQGLQLTQKQGVSILTLLSCPRDLHLILQSKPSIVLWNSLRGWLPHDWQGLELGLKLELCHLTNRLKRFYKLRSPKISCLSLNSF